MPSRVHLADSPNRNYFLVFCKLLLGFRKRLATTISLTDQSRFLGQEFFPANTARIEQLSTAKEPTASRKQRFRSLQNERITLWCRRTSAWHIALNLMLRWPRIEINEMILKGSLFSALCQANAAENRLGWDESVSSLVQSEQMSTDLPPTMRKSALRSPERDQKSNAPVSYSWCSRYNPARLMSQARHQFLQAFLGAPPAPASRFAQANPLGCSRRLFCCSSQRDEPGGPPTSHPSFDKAEFRRFLSFVVSQIPVSDFRAIFCFRASKLHSSN